jgi:hypothetical protein
MGKTLINDLTRFSTNIGGKGAGSQGGYVFVISCGVSDRGNFMAKNEAE